MALGDGAGRVRQITGAAVPFFADRVQEGDKQTGLGRTWSCPVLLIADEKADNIDAYDPERSRLARVRTHR